MQLVDTVVRTAPTGAVEVCFVGEGGDSIEVTMAHESCRSEVEAVAKAKALLVQVATFGTPVGEDQERLAEQAPDATPRAPF